MTGRRPTAAELVAAVAEFLDTAFVDREGGPGTDGQVRFHARVAANALRIVERELRTGSTEEIDRAVAGLGFADEPALAAAIRTGGLDGRADAVQAALAVLVRHRLAVAHPGYDTD